MLRSFAAAAALLLGGFLSVPATLAADLPTVRDLPQGVVKVSPVVPGMGEHWADPKTLPLGPIYCVHEGRVICLEFMMSQADFEAGKSWPELRGMPGLPPVDHLAIDFTKGHEGFEVPHYDVHMYFVSPEERGKIR